MSVPPPARPPVDAAPRQSDITVRVVVVLLLVFIVGYLLALFVSRDIWRDREGTRVTFSAQTRDGSVPSPDAMAKAIGIAKKRLGRDGASGAVVTVDGGNVIATVPKRNLDIDAMHGLFKTGQMYIRPVLQSIPAKARTPALSQSATPSPSAVPADPAQRIAVERKIRQSTDPAVQALALPIQATMCKDEDPLAGHDDPNLPLITCSSDGTAAYLLDRSIISGDEINYASSEFDQDRGVYRVEMGLTPAAATVWADFANHNWLRHTQTAFTMDTRVISAPAVREPIPDGHIDISGGFTADSAGELADVLINNSLPVSLHFVSSTDGRLPATTFVKVMRVAVIGAGVGLVLVVLAGSAYLVRRASSRRAHVTAHLRV